MRVLIVCLAYLASSYGIAASLAPLMTVTWRLDPANVINGFICIAVVLAWLAHIGMSAAWIGDRRLHKFWPISGTVAGVASYAGFVAVMSRFDLNEAIAALLLAVTFTGPALVLALHLVRFHLAKSHLRSTSL